MLTCYGSIMVETTRELLTAAQVAADNGVSYHRAQSAIEQAGVKPAEKRNHVAWFDGEAVQLIAAALNEDCQNGKK